MPSDFILGTFVGINVAILGYSLYTWWEQIKKNT